MDSFKEIREYLIENKDIIKEISQPVIQLKNELLKSEWLFIEEIKEQYNDKIKFEIANHITKELACSYEQVIISLEEINLESYLND